MSFCSSTQSPLGPIALTSDGEYLTAVELGKNVSPGIPHPIIEDAISQLAEYFAGTRTAFDLPLKAEGTDFQQSIWAALQEIPYGETISYGELGVQSGNPAPPGL